MEGLPPVDFRGDLNDEQFAAVTSPRGPALVLAGAGSGKTRTLTYRVAWLLHQGARPWDILLLTFTNKSAKEMLERVEDLTGVPRGQFWGGTFHSIGQRILRRNAAVASRTPDFTILDQKESEHLFSEIVKATDGAFIKDKTNPKAAVILDAYSHARNTLRPLPEVMTERLDWMKGGTEKLLKFCADYEAAKKERNLCDFDDLLSLWLFVLENDPAVLAHYRQRFQHILVDEFQDTNRLQSRIIDLLASEHQIMAVGDDAQCIYTWRGADWENIMAFPQRHPGTQFHTIDINYRSTPEILDFANEILRHRPQVDGFERKLRSVRSSGVQPTVFTVGDTSQQAKLVGRKILQLHHEGHALADIHVLYRAHYQSLELQMELNALGVPFVITSGHKFFDLIHIKDILAHLRFVHNPLDQVALSRLLCLLPKVGPVAAEKISKAAREINEAQGRGMVRALRDPAVLKRVPETAKDDFNDLTITLEDMLEGLEAAKSKPAPTRPDADLFRAAAEAASPKVARTPAETVRVCIEGWYGAFIKTIFPDWREREQDLQGLIGFAAKFEDIGDLVAQVALLNGESSDKKAEPEEDMLRLTTIHQSKGLEFPIVFLLGVADGLLPLTRAIDDGDVEEERRLFYVACTRAENLLFLFSPRFAVSGEGYRPLDPCRFLEEMNPDCYELADYAHRRL
ncbi:MAG: ATP-dependent helicase [Verrucomicrobia bacterium]|nr:ATP-dependent helicase [Verrucomicrobiota bacterium]NBS04120.1 ATP-dependent helicase [Verrucomicrobiota bacterium]NBY37286.1 ATP-dependent helicase [Verrucomicrobiota bacterium]